MKYTILITAYNKEKYIERCIDFACNQTYKNYEVIVVNDGSTDRTNEIIARKHKEYHFRYYHKSNTGVADTRNFIIKKVRTPYFLFVDGDDYIALDCLENIEKYSNYDYDLLSFRGVFYNEDYSVKKNIDKILYEGSGEEFFTQVMRYDFVYPWSYVYKTSFFRKHKFTYRKGYLLDDFCVTPFVILESRKLLAIDYVGYYYFEVPNSIMTKRGNDKKMFKTYERFFDSLLEQNEKGTYSQYGKDQYHYYLIYVMFWVCESLNPFQRFRLIERLKRKNAYSFLRTRGEYETYMCDLMDYHLYFPSVKYPEQVNKLYNFIKKYKKKKDIQ